MNADFQDRKILIRKKITLPELTEHTEKEINKIIKKP